MPCHTTYRSVPGAGRIGGVQNLAKGANAPLPPGPVAVRVTAASAVDISALLGAAATAVFNFLYFFTCWALAAKTPGMALAGLRVTRRDGTPLGSRHAAIRALVFPLSFIAGLGLIGVVIGREHRALHDVAADTVVLYE